MRYCEIDDMSNCKEILKCLCFRCESFLWQYRNDVGVQNKPIHENLLAVLLPVVLHGNVISSRICTITECKDTYTNLKYN